MSDNIWDLVSRNVNHDNHNIAWTRRVDKKTRAHFSYRLVFQNALMIASQLRNAGVNKGDLIGIIAPNGPEWGSAALAIWKLGAIVTPVHIGNSVDEIEEQVTVIGAKFILSFKSSMTFPNEIPIQLAQEQDEFNAEEVSIPVSVDEQDEAVRIYTSGSTGSAKMVRLSHLNICSNVRAAVAFSPPLNSSDKFLSLLPLSHAMELTGGMLFPLRNGASIVLPRALAASEILAALKEENITMLIAVPRLYRNIILGLDKKFNDAGAGLKLYRKLIKLMPMFIRTKINLPIRKQLGTHIKAWISGGSRLDPEITKAFHELGLPLRQGYGLTETSPVAAVQEEFDPVLDSVGRPLEHMEIKIDQPDNKGIGEVWIKGPNVMLGYTDEALTNEVLEDGWFKTGDLGRIDANGKLILTGRSKRLIVTEAGKNVYPEDLEIRLERLEGVKEAGVIEVEMKPAAILALDVDEPVTAAVMTMDSDDMQQAIVNAKRVLREYNSSASGHNQITRFAIVEELPRTPLGKIAIKTLPEIFNAHEIA